MEGIACTASQIAEFLSNSISDQPFSNIEVPVEMTQENEVQIGSQALDTLMDSLQNCASQRSGIINTNSPLEPLDHQFLSNFYNILKTRLQTMYCGQASLQLTKTDILGALQCIQQPEIWNTYLKLHDSWNDAVFICDSFMDVPKIEYDDMQQKFVTYSAGEIFPAEQLAEKFAQSHIRSKIYSERFDLLTKRMTKNPNILLWTDVSHGILAKNKTVVCFVEGLKLACKERQHLVGILSKNVDGYMCIQGSRSEIKIRFDQNSVIGDGIYCDGAIVLVQGIIDPGGLVLYIEEMMHPPRGPENDYDGISAFGKICSDKDVKELKDFELAVHSLFPESGRFSWVIVNEVHFDKNNNLCLLDALFSGFLQNSENLPVGFIFMGNFSETTCKDNEASTLLNKLANLLLKHKEILQHCYLLFVPGPKDSVFAPACIPRMPLPLYITSAFADQLLNAVPNCKNKLHFLTSPCRIQHFCKRMIFFRNEIFDDLAWDCLKASHCDEVTPERLSSIICETLLGQAHLYPIKPDFRITPQLDHILRLYPCPNLICLADTSMPSFIMGAGSQEQQEHLILCNCDPSFFESRAFLLYNSSENVVKRYKLPN